MYLLLFIFTIILILIVLSFTVPIILQFEFDSNRNKMQLSMFWLHTFLRATVNIDNFKPVLSIYVFQKLLFTRTLKTDKNENTKQFLKYISLKDSYIKAYYGIQNPFSLGITHGIFGFIISFFNIESVDEFPDFFSAADYMIINAGANLNLGNSFTSYFSKALINK